MTFDGIVISRMKIEDIDGVMVVEKSSFTIPWSKNALMEEVTKNKFAKYIIARVKGRVVGYAGMWKVCDEGHITNIAVHPEYRRQGIGDKLVKNLILIAEKEGIGRMTLEVRRSNIAAQNMYKKHGFVVEGFRKAYYSDNGEDAIIMWKENK
ncbi:MAG: ribosomal protein S18-alanine N-acetyltransferase [Clostridium sp.]|jgi:ribosomal-protein-alanine N-acetyltransferase|nr:ribosomal protein S18-alanine N-acetyltransferase [Clostridium sp.]